jgi:hypothetical protein
LGLVWGDGGANKSAQMRRKRYKSPSLVLDRRSFADRDGLLPTRYVFADVPYVIRRPCPLAGDSLWLVSGGVVFPNCQNCFIKRTHWAHPVSTL